MARSCHDRIKDPLVAPMEALAEDGAGLEYKIKASRVQRIDQMSKVSCGLVNAILNGQEAVLSLTGDFPICDGR